MTLTKKTDEFTVKEDTEKFLRRVKLKTHFHDKEQPSDEPQRDEFESLKPKKSNWTPPDGQFISVDLFVKKCRVDIQKLNFNKASNFEIFLKKNGLPTKILKLGTTLSSNQPTKAVPWSFGAPTFTNKKLLDN